MKKRVFFYLYHLLYFLSLPQEAAEKPTATSPWWLQWSWLIRLLKPGMMRASLPA